jgi:hypothetical protein
MASLTEQQEPVPVSAESGIFFNTALASIQEGGCNGSASTSSSCPRSSPQSRSSDCHFQANFDASIDGNRILSCRERMEKGWRISFMLPPGPSSPTCGSLACFAPCVV